MNLIEKAGIAFVMLVVVGLIIIPKGAMPLWPLSPQVNATIFERQPTFRWSGPADELLVDDNVEFTSPASASASRLSSYAFQEPLTTGDHYWKLKGNREGGPWHFYIQSKAALEVEHTPAGTVLRNRGNVDVSVLVETASEMSELTGALTVPAGKNRLLPSTFADAVEAREHEE